MASCDTGVCGGDVPPLSAVQRRIVEEEGLKEVESGGGLESRPIGLGRGAEARPHRAIGPPQQQCGDERRQGEQRASMVV